MGSSESASGARGARLSQRRSSARPLLLAAAAAVLLLLQGAAAADGQPVAVQLVLTGTPAGGLTAFVQLKSSVPVGAPLPALYASKQLLDAQPYVQGLRLQVFEGDNPTGALLVLADSAVELLIVDSFFYHLPAPALAVINSTVRIARSQADQKCAGGRLAVATAGASIAVTDSIFQGASQQGDGGVFHIQGSVLDFKNATFSNNAASGSGGAIFADTDAKVTGSSSTFANNTAADMGGAIYHSGFFPAMQGDSLFGAPGADIRTYSAATFALSNISFVRNAANSGGAVHQEFASGTIAECEFSGNTASGIGGGISQVSALVDIADSSFFGNTAEQHGGAAHQRNCVGDVLNSTFAGNAAGGNGGAVARLQSTGDVNGTQFLDNAAVQGGGVYLAASSAKNVFSNMFADGQASAEGGGLFANGSSISLLDSNTFTDLGARSGAGIYAESTSIGAVSNSVLLRGAAAADGGGLALKDCTVDSLLYGTFQNNTAARGGAITALTSKLSIAGSHFINNTAAAAAGGALFSDGGQVTLGVGNVYSPPEAALAISKR